MPRNTIFNCNEAFDRAASLILDTLESEFERKPVLAVIELRRQLSIFSGSTAFRETANRPSKNYSNSLSVMVGYPLRSANAASRNPSRTPRGAPTPKKKTHDTLNQTTLQSLSSHP